jgi:hypothetical protein
MSDVVYVYNEDEVEDAIYEILEGYEDPYGVAITGKIYAKLFHSDMTDINVAVISENKSDVETISDDEFMYWLDPESYYDEDDEVLDELANTVDTSDSDTFNGLTVVDDESGSLDYIKDAVIFTEPLSDIVEKYGVTSELETRKYSTSVNGIWFLSPDYFDEAVELEIVDDDSFRF